MSKVSHLFYNCVLHTGLPTIWSTTNRQTNFGQPHDTTWQKLGATARGQALRDTVWKLDLEGSIEEYACGDPSKPQGDMLRGTDLTSAYPSRLRILSLSSMAMATGWEQILCSVASTLEVLKLANLWYDPESYRPPADPLPELSRLSTVEFYQTLRSDCGNEDAAVERAILSRAACASVLLWAFSVINTRAMLQLAGRSIVTLELESLPPGIDGFLPQLCDATIHEVPADSAMMPASVQAISTHFEQFEYGIEDWQQYLTRQSSCPSLRSFRMMRIYYHDDWYREELEVLLGFATFLEGRGTMLRDDDDQEITTEKVKLWMQNAPTLPHVMD